MVEAATRSFWTTSRRRLIANTFANLFLLLIGAAATGEVVLGFRRWLKVSLVVVVLVVGVIAVLVVPDRGEEE